MVEDSHHLSRIILQLRRSTPRPRHYRGDRTSTHAVRFVACQRPRGSERDGNPWESTRGRLPPRLDSNPVTGPTATISCNRLPDNEQPPTLSRPARTRLARPAYRSGLVLELHGRDLLLLRPQHHPHVAVLGEVALGHGGNVLDRHGVQNLVEAYYGHERLTPLHGQPYLGEPESVFP